MPIWAGSELVGHDGRIRYRLPGATLSELHRGATKHSRNSERERQHSLVFVYILAIRRSFFGRYGEGREIKGVLSGETK